MCININILQIVTKSKCIISDMLCCCQYENGKTIIIIESIISYVVSISMYCGYSTTILECTSSNTITASNFSNPLAELNNKHIVDK